MDLSWSLDLPASVERVWALVSDTDAFNRRAGLGMRFHARDGVIRGESAVAGVSVGWKEEGFEWMEPAWFRNERAYDSGPVARVLTRCDLTETPRGTRLAYKVVVHPRSALVSPVVTGLVSLVIRPKLNTALRSLEGVLGGGDQSWDPPPPLDVERQRRLDARLRWVPEAVAASIRRRVLHSPLAVQHELNPLEVAAQDGIAPDEVIEGFLLAVKGEALAMGWRVACPRCRSGEMSSAPLGGGGERGHCDTCGIRYDGALADNMEAVFRVHPDVRPEARPVDCILSPARTPHVLAQMQLASKGELSLEPRLTEGCYRVEVEGPRAGSSSTTCLVEVSAEHTDREAVVVVGNMVHPQQICLAPGPVCLRVANQTARSVQVALVKRWRPALMCSAARVLSHPSARERLPAALLVPDLDIRARSAWALVAHAPDDLLDAVIPTLRDVEVDRQLGRLAVVCAQRPREILLAAEAMMRGGGPVGMGLARGTLVELGVGEGRRLGGPAVDEAMRLVERVGRPRVAVRLGDLDELAEALAGMGSRLTVARREDRALLVFGAMLEAAPAAGGSTVVPESPPDTPEQVGPYVVLRELDRGGMGMVLECVDPGGTRVAVKMVLPSYHTSEALTQRFFNETWYASRLVHPNLVRVVDFGLHEARPWLAMELLTGHTLGKEMARVKRMPEAQAVSVLTGVLRGLGALHAAGLVHRDLKPGNVFLVRDVPVEEGGVKLLDFGLVRRSGRHPDEGLMGTPDYMAPEQLLGDTIGPATDVYAAGVMAYRMVTGRLPFRGDPMERVTGRVSVAVDDLPDLNLLGRLEPLVRAALSALPDRPESAQDLAALLPPAR